MKVFKGPVPLMKMENLLNNLDKIVFNSIWSQKRFFIGLSNQKNFHSKTSVCFSKMLVTLSDPFTNTSMPETTIDIL